MLDVHQLKLRMRPDPSRVVIRPFNLAWNAQAPAARALALVEQVLAMDMRTARTELALVLHDFANRHLQVDRIFLKRFEEIATDLGLDGGKVKKEKRLLIGAYFCHEYSYAAAALMNPSATIHPDQTGLSPGELRIILSLRAVGEGHISSVVFREGVVKPGREFDLLPQPFCAMAASPQTPAIPRADNGVEVCSDFDTLAGTVIFPVTEAQRNGIEDLRLTHLIQPDGGVEWIGTYTAYSGAAGIRSELLRTKDFATFNLVPMTGTAASNKGMALFPKPFDGVYRMIGRQDGQNMFLLESDDLTHWDEGVPLLQPKHPWELIQIGNCGPPIEIDEGWLLLTHGVGAMRKYAIGAVLLDKADPAKVLGRTPVPILSPADEDREGYVPNVVYSCGGIRVGADIFLPYGVADSSVAFAFVAINDLLETM